MKKFVLGYLVGGWVASYIVQQATGQTIQDLARKIQSRQTANTVDVDLLAKRFKQHLDRMQN